MLSRARAAPAARHHHVSSRLASSSSSRVVVAPRAPLLRGRSTPFSRAARVGKIYTASSSVTEASTRTVVHVETATELEDIIASCAREKRKCVVNVSTSKCGPCKMLLPTLEKYAREHGDSATFVKFHSDEGEDLKRVASEWAVQQVPTYRLIREDGETHAQFTTGKPDSLGGKLYLFLT
ncbi:uncharacterized protein MICPUCDRAFT_53709 [Micromonas pusilla CCMP1545]|jgi:thiol-disulfide isomerase/thioredoxin|uniref:Predicted protein n=2 Tax=Micromonas pusilla TaxID=38833 RepID=C1N7I7_MICPC|nr:uncharacterized protein MICPUCDRAFT_53709 [Micromonas pusilla CCMP1545]EEH52113.1 predicted protein [Micromonas pusilla CCMP1545]|eukprot:XP_003063740.1 predicted protein [Micromonas pusilla CCMP1545]